MLTLVIFRNLFLILSKHVSCVVVCTMPPLPRDKKQGGRDNRQLVLGIWGTVYFRVSFACVYVRYYTCLYISSFLLTLPDLGLISFANKKEDYLHLNNVTRNDTSQTTVTEVSLRYFSLCSLHNCCWYCVAWLPGSCFLHCLYIGHIYTYNI